MNQRTRIKLCGLTSVEDAQSAVTAGADAIGLVFYPPSPRYVSPAQAARLIASLPPFVTAVGLFVNATTEEVVDVVRQAPVSLLQFHGDETLEQCCQIAHAVNRPFLRAVRVTPDLTSADLLKCHNDFRAASDLFAGLLLDAVVEGYGGGGKVFDWSIVSAELGPKVVLSGGLNPKNVGDAVGQVQPYAVDVSSGIEHLKGIKDATLMREFVDAVVAADCPGRVPHAQAKPDSTT